MPASTWIMGALVAFGAGDLAALDLVIAPRALATRAPVQAQVASIVIERPVPPRAESTSNEAPAPVIEPEEDLAPVTVYFDTDRATLDDAAARALDPIAASAARDGTITVEVIGHADARGTERHNLQLSAQRMERVRAYLVAHGVAAARVRGRAAGAREPARAGTSRDALAANRRAEIRRKR